MNDLGKTTQFAEPHIGRTLAAVGIMVIAIVIESIFEAMMLYRGYSDNLAIGIGIGYATAAIASVFCALPFLRSEAPGSPLESMFICLIAPLVIQFQFIAWFLQILVRLPFTIFRFSRRKPKLRRKASAPKTNRLEKLVRLRVGDPVTFTPPGEVPLLGVVKRINQKSTTVVDQTGEAWRVPHNDSERIVRSKAAPLKTKNIRQLELV